MRNFFSKPHPWIMQGIGGLLAVIIIIPIAIYVVQSILNSAPAESATTYGVPGASATQAAEQASSSGPKGSGAPNGTGAPHPFSGKVYTVKMQPGPNNTYVFSPAKITIHAGDKVHWVDVNNVAHNIVGIAGASNIIDRIAINTDPYTVLFDKPGTYHYECQVHLPSMVGVVTVLPAASGSPAAALTATPTSRGAHYSVKMQPGPGGTYVFSPASLHIHTGDTVTWVDVNSTPHNIVGLGNAASIINRSAINTDSYSVTFTSSGTYHYECQVHLPSMVGVIYVS